jgi:hypothetical protein
MVESFKHVPAFYERLTPPPVELPLLTAQTGLYYAVIKPPPLLGVAQFPAIAFPERASSRGPHPPYRLPAKYVTRFATPSRRDGSVGPSSQPNLTPNEDENGDAAQFQIPRPTGEVGRPGRGGYNLEEKLAWAPDEYEKLKVCETSLISTHRY